VRTSISPHGRATAEPRILSPLKKGKSPARRQTNRSIDDDESPAVSPVYLRGPCGLSFWRQELNTRKIRPAQEASPKHGRSRNRSRDQVSSRKPRTNRLKPGESYPPIVPASAHMPELTPRSIAWGIALCIIFTVASAYSGLKVGQVMESAIPISILAIGMARLYPRRSTLLENVIITGIGGVAGSVVAGAVFTVPALYILNLDPHPVETIFICLAGGCLGVLFLIPLRRYFVRDMHGLLSLPRKPLPSPKSWSQARKADRKPSLLLQATLIAGVL